MNILKKTLYNITRPYAKKYLTGNLGKVVEDDEKITCYVKKSRIKKKDNHYTIACDGIEEKRKKVAKAYNLNKPICYVIDGLEFKKHIVYIFGYNDCEVIVKNCNFGLNLHIRVNGKCTLDNTNIITFSYLLISANELIIKNMDSEQIRVISYESNIGFSANNRIEVIDSNIGNKKKNVAVSFLATKELNVVNSNISSKEVTCESSKITIDKNSSLTATDKVSLKTEDFGQINITAPTINLNGEKIITDKKPVILRKTTNPLEIKRLELVNLLKNIKNECETISSDKVVEYEEELKVQPIIKVLKK